MIGKNFYLYGYIKDFDNPKGSFPANILHSSSLIFIDKQTKINWKSLEIDKHFKITNGNKY